MSYQITEEEKNTVKLNSPFALPDSPTSCGMKAGEIKRLHWQAYMTLIEIINDHLSDVYNDKQALNNQKSSVRYELSRQHLRLSLDIDDVNKNDLYILNDGGNGIAALVVTDTEDTSYYDVAITASSIESEVFEVGKRYKYTAKGITMLALGCIATEPKLNEHISSTTAHTDIRELVATAQARADSAHNLASGKSKVHVATSNSHLCQLLSGGQTSEGDIIISTDMGRAELIVLGDTMGEFTAFNLDSLESESVTFRAGLEYLYSDGEVTVPLIAIESGFDTSALATRVELNTALGEIDTALENIIKLQNQYINGGTA